MRAFEQLSTTNANHIDVDLLNNYGINICFDILFSGLLGGSLITQVKHWIWGWINIQLMEQVVPYGIHHKQIR